MDILFYGVLVAAYHTHIIAPIPEVPVPILILRCAYRPKIIIALFPFRYPMNDDIFSFGGKLTDIWIWSGIACASMI